MKRRILYLGYTNPGGYPPLEHSSRILAAAGWDVLVLGLRLGVLALPPRERIQVRLLDAYSSGWHQKLHFLWFCVWSAAWALYWRPRWIYASDQNACPAALAAAALVRAQIIYHEHDSPSPARKRSWFQRLLLKARRACAKRATMSILPNHERAESFRSESGAAAVDVVWNCPARDEARLARAEAPARRLRVLYHGSIVPERLPMTVIEALAELPDGVSLDVAGYETAGSPGYVARMIRRARELGAEHRLRFHGMMPLRADLLGLARSCDAGLSLMPAASEDVNLRMMTGASNKAFDYMACGLALVVSDLGEWRRMYCGPGLAVTCDPGDPRSITRTIRWLYENPRQMRAMGERGRLRILTEWNYETQFAPVFELLEGAGRAAECSSRLVRTAQ